MVFGQVQKRKYLSDMDKKERRFFVENSHNANDNKRSFQERGKSP